MKSFKYRIRWNGGDYSILSYTNVRVSILINKCIHTLKLLDKSQAKYSLELADGGMLESNSVIPFVGIADTLILTYRNQNTTIMKKLEEYQNGQEYDSSSVDRQSV